MATGALVEEVIEEVADNLEEASVLARRIDSRAVGIFLGGLGVGVAIGFYFGYRYNKEKLRAEAFRESEEEVEKIRELYEQKSIAAKAKPDIEEVIIERGYSTQVRDEELHERPLPPPVPVAEPPVVRGISTWNYAVELENRSPEHPYVIHREEFEGEEREGYSHVNYTYYAGDDVLVGEDERPVPHGDLVVGQDNLKFGHGSDDPNVVFIRNERLELEIEIVQTSGSYEEEVLGLQRDQD